MTKTAKLTTKGQITVPLDVRKALGVRAGDRLVFESSESGFRLRAVRSESPFAQYRGMGVPGVGRGRAAVVRAVRQMRGE
jgi:AbrB family looped-hinge helix DNA binding protein